MIWLVGITIGLFMFVGVPILIVVYEEYSESKKNVYNIKINGVDTGKSFQYSNSETRNIKMSFSEFEPLYRGNRQEWEIVERDQGDLLPFYTGLYKTENVVYFVHFKTWKDYRKFKKKYNPDKGKNNETELAYEKIAGDVSDKIRIYLDEVEAKREKAMNDMGKTLDNIKLKLSNEAQTQTGTQPKSK